MKERPILFIAPMVRAILDGTKSQTRRIAKTYPGCHIEIQNGTAVSVNTNFGGDGEVLWCPYGKAGDRLWVRETWAALASEDHMKPTECRRDVRFYEVEHGAQRGTNPRIGKARPSIFMPRWHSRITLEVTAVRVERLQEISEADCCAEGCGSPITRDYKKPKYKALWESINGHGSWDENPWVWCIEFKRVLP